MWRRALWAWLLAMPTWALGAPPVPAAAIVTILDGDAVLTRGAQRLALAEGVRLFKDDIVESGPQARLLRFEFGDGAIVDLGPATRVMLSPRLAAARSRVVPTLYVLQGWAKLTAPPAAATPGAFLTPAFDVSELTRHLVLSIEPADAAAFAESGQAVLLERRAGRAMDSWPLRSGSFFMRSGDAKPSVTSRPAAGFLQRVPKPFLDTLPPRAEVFKAREAEPKPLGPIAYADVAAWLAAEPALRTLFAARWRAQAQAPEFRKSLIANLQAHPEWDRTLYPEKYLPKPAPAAAR